MTVLAVFIGGFGLDCFGINISDGLSRCSCRTKPNYLYHQSSLEGCRFDRSGSSGLVDRFLEDFGFNQLVMQVVEIVLHFVVGQFAVDQVAEVVVVIGHAVVGFQAVVRDGKYIVVGQDIVSGLRLITRTNYCIICCFNFWSKEFSMKIKSCLLNNPLSFSNTFLSNNKIFCIKGSFSGNSFLFIIKIAVNALKRKASG